MIALGLAVAGVVLTPVAAIAAEVALAHTSDPASVAKAAMFKTILERQTDHTVALVAVPAGEVVAAVVDGRATATFDADPDAASFVPVAGDPTVEDLGPNQMGGLPERRTVAATALLQAEPGVGELLNLFFVSPSRLEDAAALVTDGAFNADGMQAWVDANWQWINNMLALCPQLASEACPAPDGAQERFEPSQWYGAPQHDPH